MRTIHILITLAAAMALAAAPVGAQEAAPATPEVIAAPAQLPPPAAPEVVPATLEPTSVQIPMNQPEASVNVTTGTGGNEMGELASRSTEQALDRLVNITFVNADLENALRVIARQMDLNIIMGGAVADCQITLDLKDVPLRFALDSILRSNELGYIVEPGGIVRVVPASTIREDDIERQLLVRRLNWQIAAEIQPAIEEFVTERGTLRTDPATNSVIIEDIPSRIQEIERLLEELDSPERQVMIEARLVEVSENFSRGLEANLSIGQVDSQPNDTAGTTGNFAGNAPANLPFQTLNTNYVGEETFIPADALGFVSAAVSNPNAAWSYGTELLGFDVGVLLEAAQQSGLARILAAPRVATVNNVPATIDIQREEPYVESTFNPGGQTTQSVLFKDVGLKLQVTPRITNNGFVRMQLQPEQTVLVDTVTLEGGDVPVVARRSSTTNVIVQDQRTAILGGLRELDARNSEDGTPWFMDLPVIGFMFRGNTYNRDLTDFYMFVTPTIIQDPTLEASERYAHDLLDLEWNLPEDYFMDDVRIETTY